MAQEKPQAAKAFEQLLPISWFYATEYRQQEDGNPAGRRHRKR